MDKIIPADTLVSIGVPVRNGADWLADALEQLINQTHQNLEIILSNNNSTDGTDKICQRYAERDSRIRYTRHNTTLGAADSFRYVLDQARADYFMWAAHDDRHSLNYVQKLLEALMANKNAALAFSEVAIFHHPDTWRTATPRKYKFECNGQGRFWRGLLGREYIRDGYLHIYGLIRKSAIQSYPWPTIELGGDRPLLLLLLQTRTKKIQRAASYICLRQRCASISLHTIKLGLCTVGL
jgi:glycosyltransferase involved in cell wall biosynthesis